MTRTLGTLFALLFLAAVPAAKAGGTINIKCAPNEDRVWVYESLTDFNVAAKLKCGEAVQIVERVKGYVKIETANGTEGYVLDTNFPKSALPPPPVEKPNDVESAAAAFAAHRASRAPDSSVDAPANPHPSAPVTVASTASPAAAKPVAPSQPPLQAHAAVSVAVAAPPAVAAQPTATAPATPVVAKNSNSVPVAAPAAAPVVSANQPAKSPAPAPQPAPATATVVAPPPATRVVEVSAPAPPVAAPVKSAVVAPANNPAPVAAVSSSSVSVAPPTPSEVNNASSMTIETSATLQPVADATPRAAANYTKPPVNHSANPDDEEDSAVSALNNEMASCTQYFSAYGLSANQYKWLAQNRHKAFPSVCPAPTPALVDFVVIFTHDVPFYNVTMPNAVHTDLNGFSDWTPLTTVDTAVISASDADKSHHEYVWVFHTTRGAFDPSKFSARRRPLYSKAETNVLGSRGGFRTVMDALTFIEQNGTTR
jgi:Bacterial SH3 domain